METTLADELSYVIRKLDRQIAELGRSGVRDDSLEKRRAQLYESLRGVWYDNRASDEDEER